MLKVSMKLGGLPKLLRRVKGSLFKASYKGLETSAKKLAPEYRRRIQMGVGASGRPLKPIRNSTLDMPIRMGGPDTRIRRTVNNSKSPINATGKTASSITPKRLNIDAWEISSSTPKGDMILAVNAKVSPSSNIKQVRDPLQVAKPQVDTVEKEILKEIDRLF